MDEQQIEPTLRVGPPLNERALERGTLVDHFVILERLGMGGAGSVYAAWDPQLSRRVALKVLHDGASADGDDRARMVREARALAQLSHDNVVRVHSLGTFQDTPYVVMELVEGESLEALLRRRDLQPAEVLRIFSAAGRGLLAVHKLGIVHRDIKPANILVGRDGRVCIGDFGLAVSRHSIREPPAEEDDPAALTDAREAIEEEHDPLSAMTSLDLIITKDGDVPGTPAFMAPEQLLGEALDPRCDQFSFCVALWRALCGLDPFGGQRNLAQRLTAMETNVLVAPTRSLAAVTRVLQRGLSFRREARFADMEELLLALDAAALRPRRIAMAAAGSLGAVAAACAVLIALPALRSADDPCGVKRRVAATLSADDRALLTPPGQVTSARPTRGDAVAHLDAWLGHWSALAEKSCALPRTPERDTFERCLDRRLEETAALVAVLRASGETAWREAMPAVQGLVSPRECEDASARADDGMVDDGTSAVRRSLQHAQATWLTGRTTEAIRLARALVEDDVTRRKQGLEAEVRLLMGRALGDQGDFAHSEEELRTAVSLAMSASRADVEAASWVELVKVVGDRAKRYDEAMRMLPLMRASVARVGQEREIQAHAALTEALTVAGKSRREEAQHAIDEAVRLARARVPVDARLLSRVLQVRGVILHQRSESRRGLESMAEALEVLGSAFPPGHIAFVPVLNNAGYINQEIGNVDEAEIYFLRAAKIVESYGADQANSLAVVTMNLGHVAHVRGDLLEARARAERARTLFLSSVGPDHLSTARAEEQLAQVEIEEANWDEATTRLAEVDRIRRLNRPGDAARLDADVSSALLDVERRGSAAVDQARTRLESLYSSAGKPEPERVRAALALGILAWKQADWQAARGYFSEARAQLQAFPDPYSRRTLDVADVFVDRQGSGINNDALLRQCRALPRDKQTGRLVRELCGLHPHSEGR